MHKALNYLGLARKGGMAELGEEPVGAAARAGHAVLVIVAADAGDHTWRRAKSDVAGTQQQCLRVPFTKDELGQAIGRWGNFMNREAFGSSTTLPWRMRLWTSATSYIEVHPTFLYESLWNLVGLALILFIITKGRRFDGENTWFYFLWYGIGRTWVEGLRTDSLYLFNWTLMGQPIRVSQALSAVMVLVSAAMLLYNIKMRPHSPEELLVNQAAAASTAPAAGADPAADPQDAEIVKEEQEDGDNH